MPGESAQSRRTRAATSADTLAMSCSRSAGPFVVGGYLLRPRPETDISRLRTHCDDEFSRKTAVSADAVPGRTSHNDTHILIRAYTCPVDADEPSNPAACTVHDDACAAKSSVVDTIHSAGPMRIAPVGTQPAWCAMAVFLRQ